MISLPRCPQVRSGCREVRLPSAEAIFPDRYGNIRCIRALGHEERGTDHLYPERSDDASSLHDS